MLQLREHPVALQPAVQGQRHRRLVNHLPLARGDEVGDDLAVREDVLEVSFSCTSLHAHTSRDH